MDPAHGPPLQARVAAANGTVLAACKLLALTDNKPPALLNGDPGAHGHEQGANEAKMDGAKQTERGQELDEGSGYGRQRRQTKAR